MRFPQITQAIEVEFQGKRGFLCESLDEAVAHCVREAVRYGGSSTLTIKVGFKSEGQKTMRVGASIEATTPKPQAMPIVAYVDREARLRADDPYQQTIEFPRAAAVGDLEEGTTNE